MGEIYKLKESLKTEKMVQKLNLRQQLFCKYFVDHYSTLGNATQSYMKAYNLGDDKINSAQAASSRLLKNTKVLERLKWMLTESDMARMVDFEHQKLIMQDENLSAKISAIVLYNKKRGRI